MTQTETENDKETKRDTDTDKERQRPRTTKRQTEKERHRPRTTKRQRQRQRQRTTTSQRQRHSHRQRETETDRDRERPRTTKRQRQRTTKRQRETQPPTKRDTATDKEGQRPTTRPTIGLKRLCGAVRDLDWGIIHRAFWFSWDVYFDAIDAAEITKSSFGKRDYKRAGVQRCTCEEPDECSCIGGEEGVCYISHEDSDTHCQMMMMEYAEKDAERVLVIAFRGTNSITNLGTDCTFKRRHLKEPEKGKPTPLEFLEEEHEVGLMDNMMQASGATGVQAV